MKLSFVKYGPDGEINNGWIVPQPHEGRSRAEELVAYVRETNDVPAFVRVVTDAVKSNDQSVRPFLFSLGCQITDSNE